MKIAILSPATLHDFQEMIGEELPEGLIFNSLTPLIQYFIEQKHEVYLVTLDKNIKKSKVVKGKNITIFIGKYRKTAKVRAADNFAYEVYQMTQFLKKNPCDIYHANWSYEFAKAALNISVKKTLITLHDWAPEVYRHLHDYYRKKRLNMNNSVIEKGEHFSTVSPYIEQQFREQYSDKIMSVIPNCIETVGVYDYGRQLCKGNSTILCVNNGFTPLKNVEKSILAFQIYCKKNKDAYLYLYGLGFEPDGACKEWVKKNNIDDEKIIYCGKVSHNEIVRRMSEADVLLHASKEESFGLVLAEAMMVGTPVIGGDKSGAVPWVLNYGSAGILVDIDSEKEIANALEYLLGDDEIWKMYSRSGYEYANSKFEIEAIGKKYLEEYYHIVGE